MIALQPSETHTQKKKTTALDACGMVGLTLTHAAAEQQGKDQRKGGSPPSSHPQPCRLLSVRPLICHRRIKPTPPANLQLYC